jgi:penicillin-binding protein 1C
MINKSYIIYGTTFLIFVLVVAIFWPIPESKLKPERFCSLQILDRHGNLLREVLSSQEGISHWVSLNEVSPYFIQAVITGEDNRFYKHFGLDPLAIIRAIYQNIKAGRIVSGGSTITQQLARTLYPRPRNLLWKFIEAITSLRLEIYLTKDEILTYYINRVCFGNQAYGIEAASRLYFDKPSLHLSLAEASFLAGLPCSPTKYDPYRYLERAKKRQKKILKQLYKKKKIDTDQYKRALKEKLNLIPKERKFRAPHFVDFVLMRMKKSKLKNVSKIYTTLDWYLQKNVELLTKVHIANLKEYGVTNAAVLIMNNQTGEIITMVGSANFFDPVHDGQVNGVISLRQPGSTLKPFTYGLALERGMTLGEIIPDLPLHTATAGGDFTPRNYDRKFHGPVRLRAALACSYNIPAVRILKQMGTDLLLQRLKQAGFENLKKSAIYYGPGLTLGNAEVTLLELVRAYSVLSNKGILKYEKIFLEIRNPEDEPVPLPEIRKNKKIFSPQIAYLLTDVLSDYDARVPAFGMNCPLNLPFPCAAKTGTSKDYRDNWTVGYTPNYTVGVWVGNFDGKPMYRVSGISGAGPLFRNIFLLLSRRNNDDKEFEKPKNLVRINICPVSGELVKDICPGKIEEIFIDGTEPNTECSVHQLFRIDKRNGLLAQDNCPKEMIENRVYEIYPPLYREWMAEQNIPSPPQTYSSLDKTEEKKDKISIIFPDDGDIFKIDPILRREYQTLFLKAVVPDGIKEIYWLVNGKLLGKVSSPFSFPWRLEKGTHFFQVMTKIETKKYYSKIVKIKVL